MTRGTEHTPEPWQLNPDDPADVWDTGEYPAFVARCATTRKFQPREVDEANARRIVACINYCAGVETAELEKWTKLSSRLRATLNALEGRRVP